MLYIHVTEYYTVMRLYAGVSVCKKLQNIVKIKHIISLLAQVHLHVFKSHKMLLELSEKMVMVLISVNPVLYQAELG